MSRRPKYPDPFFMLFPWLRAAGLMCLVGFAGLFIYRLSETGGNHSRQACLAAIITSGAAGLCGLYPIGKIWRREVMIAVAAIMTGSAIRLLIGGAGVAIITFFTQINKSWYIFYIGIYYILFMAVDTGLALWMAAYCRRDDDN